MNLKSSHWSKCIITLPALFKPWDLLCHHSHKICKQFIICYCQKKKKIASFNLKCMDEISTETGWTLLSFDTDYYAPQDVLWLKSWSLTIQMKATEQFFPAVLIILLCKVVACLLSLWVKSQSVTIGMKAFVKHFPGVLCIALNESPSKIISSVKNLSHFFQSNIKFL